MEVLDDTEDFKTPDPFKRFKITLTLDYDKGEDTFTLTAERWTLRHGVAQFLVGPHTTKIFPLDKIVELTVEDTDPAPPPPARNLIP